MNKNSPLDIMMPFYGRFDHLRTAVESVLNQTDQNWRLIVVDDVYPDLAPGIWVQSILDPRVIYIRNKQNLKPSRNYNKCIELARSEFVVLMGCDDVLLPGYVASIRRLAEKFPTAAVIQPGVSVIDESGRPSRPLADRVKALYRFRGNGARLFSGEKLAASLMRGNWTYFPSLAWRRELVGHYRFRTDLDVVQDLAMLVNITVGGGDLVLDDEIVFNYRRHSASVSAVTGPDGTKFAQEQILFSECVSRFRVLGWKVATNAAAVHFTSRLNALSELPNALHSSNRAGCRSLIHHVLHRER